MTTPSSPTPPSRRRFLAAAGGTSSLLFPGINAIGAAKKGVSETDHFWYKTAPADGPYIDTQRGSKAFGFRDGKIFMSEDNGSSWPHENILADAENIMFSCFLENGNLVFATLNKIFLSKDNLKTYEEISVKDRDGSDYSRHTSLDPEKPGSYFYSLDGIHTHQVEGSEMMIWGNYCNVRKGAVPVNIF